jgi:hypothetical protein
MNGKTGFRKIQQKKSDKIKIAAPIRIRSLQILQPQSQILNIKKT